MSISTKPINEITYADVEIFCAIVKQKEGLRLDYKQSISKDLSKLIAAFANTSGGMIVFGVTTNAQNEPEWPPKGMPLVPGVSETITQVAQNAIYPPVELECTGLIEIPEGNQAGVMIVRVNESPAAPHATDSGRKIYERTGEINAPIQHAHVDRIEKLLARRYRASQKLDEVRTQFFKRAARFLPEEKNAIRWISVMPLFPGAPLTTATSCYEFAASKPHYGHLQRTQDGAYIAEGTPKGTAPQGRVSCKSFGYYGDFCAAQYCEEEWIHRANALAIKSMGLTSTPTDSDRFLNLASSLQFFWKSAFEGVSYLRSTIGYQGFIQIAIGIRNSSLVRLVPFIIGPDTGARFLDEAYVDDEVISSASVLTPNEVETLFARFQSAYDLEPVSFKKWYDGGMLIQR